MEIHLAIDTSKLSKFVEIVLRDEAIGICNISKYLYPRVLRLLQSFSKFSGEIVSVLYTNGLRFLGFVLSVSLMTLTRFLGSTFISVILMGLLLECR